MLPLARKVFFLTGIRSEYDIFAPVIEAVSTHAGLEPGVIATGAHLCADFGYTIRQIEADGFPIVSRIDSLLRSDGLSGRVKGAALQIAGLSDLLANNRPDFLAVMGDREESITGALAGAYHHVPVVHLGGGDHADDANVDNLVRHAVTKLSHLHMAASERSAARILGLGEEPWRVHMTGASGLDRIVSTPLMSRADVMDGLGVTWGDSPFLVLIYHPTITDFADSRAHMAMILETLERVGEKIVILFPNSDPGNGGVIEALQAFVARSDIAIAAPFLERRLFVNMLRQAACLVGNSSAGIIEAPTLRLPVVNIGMRQRGREHADNVVFVDYDPAEIESALRKALHDPAFRAAATSGRSPYGEGRAGPMIADILAGVELGPKLMNKKITF